MATIQHGKTTIEPSGNAVAPANVSPLDFTDLIKSARNLQAANVEDHSNQILLDAIASYSQGMAALRQNKGDEFGDADIKAYNTQSKQALMVSMLAAGVDLTDSNKAMTAMNHVMEADTQYTEQSKGGFIIKQDGNGNTTVIPDKGYAKRAQAEAMAALSPASQLVIAKTKETDPTTAIALQTNLINTQSQTDQFNAQAEVRKAQFESLKNADQLNEHKSQALIAAATRERFDLLKNSNKGTLEQLNLGKITPEQAKNLLKDDWRRLSSEPSFISEMNTYGVNLNKIDAITQQQVPAYINELVDAFDPVKPLTQKGLYYKSFNELFDAKSIANLPDHLKNQAQLAGLFEDITTAMPLIRAISTDKLMLLYTAQQATMPRIGKLLDKVHQPDATKVDFDDMSSVVEKVLINVAEGYERVGEEGQPAVAPHVMEAVIDLMFNDPSYEKFATPEQRQLHKRLLAQARKGYSKNRKLNDLIKELAVDQKSLIFADTPARLSQKPTKE